MTYKDRLLTNVIKIDRSNKNLSPLLLLF